MDNQRWKDAIFAKDKNYAEGQIPPLRLFRYVSPGLFQTDGTPLVAGRDFTWTDVYEKLRVTIVSETGARNVGIAGAALGKQVRGS